MRVTLEPQWQLMHQLLQLTSKPWEVKQIVTASSGDDHARREFRCLLLHAGKMFTELFEKSWKLLVDKVAWAQIPETESFRTDICRLLLRCASVVTQLVLMRTTALPFKLFVLLIDDTQRPHRVREILNIAPCMRCKFSKPIP